MKIAIDARCLNERATSNYSYWHGLVCGLIAGLESFRGAELFLLSNRPIEANGLPQGRFSIQIVPSRSDRWWSLVTLPRAARRLGANVVHVQYFVSPWFRTPVVTTVHDVSFFIEPRWFRVRDRVLLQRTVPSSCARASAVIAVSETSKKEIVRYARVNADRVHVVYNGIEPTLRPAPRAPGPPSVLGVGILNPRKNWRLALEATFIARQHLTDLRLTLVGRNSEAPGVFESALQRNEDGSEWVLNMGEQAQERMARIYSSARLLVHPSFHEGFGLTPLEAMACRTPVLASTGGAIPEITAGHARLLPPNDARAWADAIVDLIRQPPTPEELDRAEAHARSFTWRRAARQTLDVYEAVAR
jgi:glycosyltransferase involved in cell wall biosynthesis